MLKKDKPLFGFGEGFLMIIMFISDSFSNQVKDILLLYLRVITQAREDQI
jgi:hypothetical protein